MRRVRPEFEAGGFARDSPTVMFFVRVQALLNPSMSVLDFGAGRGASVQPDKSSFNTELQRLKGKVARVIGVDIDVGVLEHRFLDERIVVEPDAPLPFPEETFDVVVARWVLEHLDDPSGFAREMYRILKPGGWLCAITPNRLGYVGVFTNLIANKWHRPLKRALRPGTIDRNVFPTRYRLNTLAAIHRHFPETLWLNASYAYSGIPRYHANSYFLFSLISTYQRIMPAALGTDLMIYLRKKPDEHAEPIQAARSALPCPK